jgi:TP901 family phage tail tape measure protein
MPRLQQAGLEWVNQGLNGFLGGIDKANTAMQSTGDAGNKSNLGLAALTGGIMGVASSITSSFLGAVGNAGKALVGLAKNSIGVAMEFESMNTSLQIAGKVAATEAGVALGDLSEMALKVGGDTRLLGVSASGAADAMTGLLKNGLSLEDVMGDVNTYMEEGGQLGGVLRASIDLAAASELDMVRASDLAGASMKIFQLDTKDALKTMNYFVKAADASAADVTDIEQALVNAGPSMTTFGFTVEETADAIALLTNTGIRGSEAGTALRSTFENMSRQTPKVTAALEKYGIALQDEEGNFYDLIEIIGQFEIAMDGMTEAERSNFAATVAGTYGKKGLLALVNQGVEGWNKYQVAVNNATGIMEQSERRAGTLAGQKEALEGSIETLRIRIGTAFLPALTSMNGAFNTIVEKTGPLITKVFGTIGDAVSGVVQGLAGFVSGAPGDFPWEDIFPPWLADIMYRLSGAFEDLISYTTPIKSFFAGLQMFTDTGGFAGATQMKDALDALPKPIANIVEWVATKLIPTIEGFKSKISEFLNALGWWLNIVVTDGDLLNDYLTLLPEPFQNVVRTVVEEVIPALTNIWEWITTKVIPVVGDLASIYLTYLSSVLQIAATIFTTVLLPALGDIWTFVKDNVLPIIGDLIIWFTENLPPAIEVVKQFILTVLIPALAEAWSYFNKNVLPILAEVFKWLQTNVPTAIETAKKFVVETLIPALTEAWKYINENVVPVLETAVLWLQENIPVAIEAVKKWFLEELVPALEIAWEWFNDYIVPVMINVADTIETGLNIALDALIVLWELIAPLLDAAWKLFNDSILPVMQAIDGVLREALNLALEALAGILEKTINPLLESFWSDLKDAKEMVVGMAEDLKEGLAPALDWVSEAAKKVVGWFEDIKNGLANVTLPDWMKPGSPPPLYYALTDIANAMDSVSDKTVELRYDMESLPSMDASMALEGMPVMGGMQSSSVDHSRHVNIEMNPTYANAQSEASIYYDLTAALVSAQL